MFVLGTTRLNKITAGTRVFEPVFTSERAVREEVREEREGEREKRDYVSMCG